MPVVGKGVVLIMNVLIIKKNLDKLIRAIRAIKIKKVVSLLQENRKILLVFVVIAIFADIFFIKRSSDLVIFGILLLYGVFAKILQIKSKSTFLLCLGLLGAMFVNFLSSGASIPTEKAAVWLFLFMALGIIQQWRE
jgi:hypothetical protein